MKTTRKPRNPLQRAEICKLDLATDMPLSVHINEGTHIGIFHVRMCYVFVLYVMCMKLHFCAYTRDRHTDTPNDFNARMDDITAARDGDSIMASRNSRGSPKPSKRTLNNSFFSIISERFEKKEEQSISRSDCRLLVATSSSDYIPNWPAIPAK